MYDLQAKKLPPKNNLLSNPPAKVTDPAKSSPDDKIKLCPFRSSGIKEALIEL